MTWQNAAWVVGGLILAWAVAMLVFRLASRRPANLGVHEGRLAPCPATPNCVCSFDSAPPSRIDPLPFFGSPAEATARLRAILAGLPRVAIIAETGDYLHAEFRSFLFRFVDDVEFLIDDAAKVIHCRSASRAGRSDFGVNRRRMEAIWRAFPRSSETRG